MVRPRDENGRFLVKTKKTKVLILWAHQCVLTSHYPSCISLFCDAFNFRWPQSHALHFSEVVRENPLCQRARLNELRQRREYCGIPILYWYIYMSHRFIYIHVPISSECSCYCRSIVDDATDCSSDTDAHGPTSISTDGPSSFSTDSPTTISTDGPTSISTDAIHDANVAISFNVYGGVYDAIITIA